MSEQRGELPLWAMIDLETAGTRTDAAVLQCGIVGFHPSHNYLVEAREWNVNMMSSVLHGGVADTGATDFWRRRPDQWDALTNDAITIPRLLDKLDAWWAKEQPEQVWCHGATFDVPILQGYYERLGRRTPWKYSAVRDTRTLFATAAVHVLWERPERETIHMGKDDAIAQAEDVNSAWKALLGERRAVLPFSAG